MDNSNFPSATVTTQTDSRKNKKSLLVWLLAGGILCLSSYMVYEMTKTSQQIRQEETKILAISNEKSEVQKSFDASLARLDSMTGVNNGLQSKLEAQQTEIARTKAQIRTILNKGTATVAELNTAKTLIAGLNSRITNLEADVARLTGENKSLNQEKIVLTADKEKLTRDLQATVMVKQDLEKKVEIASTLNASNIAITPVNIKGNGREKVTHTAKRVDKLLISFDVDNRIAQAGITDIYVLVIGPDGKAVVPDASGPGTFTTREEGEKTFTARLPVDIETAKKKNIEYAFIPGSSFQKGNYTIRIYQNGFLIGQSSQELKKGGLFS